MSFKVAFGILFLICLSYLSTPQASHALECFEIPATSALVCSGNGTCIATDLCECFDGFSGDVCEFPECFGKNTTDPDVCSGVGKCIGLDHCDCGEYEGDECQIAPCDIDTVGIPEYTIDRNRDLAMSVEVHSSCDGVAYTWEQTHGENVTSFEQFGPTLVLKAFSFPRDGVYAFKLTVNAKSRPTGLWMSFSVTVSPSPLLVSISGGDRVVSNLRTINVEASYNDPDNENVQRSFAWTCDANGHACPNTIKSVVEATTGNILSLPIGVPAGIYTLEVTFSKSSRNSKAQVKLTVVAKNIPEVSIISSFEKVVARRDLEVEASISSSSDSISTEWYINNELMTTSDRVKVFKKKLSIRNDFLMHGVRYTILCSAKNEAGTASAAVTFFINGLPQGGFATISPESGIALTTAFTLQAKHWYDVDWLDYYGDRSALRYSWLFYEGNKLVTLTRPSFEPTLHIPMLPYSPSLKIVLLVYDRHGDYRSRDLDITVTITRALFSNENEKMISLKNIVEKLPRVVSRADLDMTTITIDTIAASLSDGSDISTRSIVTQPVSETQPTKENVATELLKVVMDAQTVLQNMNQVDSSALTQIGYNILHITSTGLLSHESKVIAHEFIGKLVDLIGSDINYELADLYLRNVDILADVNIQKSDLLINKIMNKLSANQIAGVASQFNYNKLVGSTIKLGVEDFSGFTLTLPACAVTMNKQVSVTFPSEVVDKLTAAQLTEAVVKVQAYDVSANPHPYTNTKTSISTAPAVSIEVLSLAGDVQSIDNLLNGGISFTIPATIDTTKTGNEQHCRYYSENTAKWISDETCKTKSFTADQIECQCSHLNLFTATSDQTPTQRNVALIVVPAVVVPAGVGLIVLVAIIVIVSVIFVNRSKKTNYKNGDIEMRDTHQGYIVSVEIEENRNAVNGKIPKPRK